MTRLWRALSTSLDIHANTHARTHTLTHSVTHLLQSSNKGQLCCINVAGGESSLHVYIAFSQITMHVSVYVCVKFLTSISEL